MLHRLPAIFGRVEYLLVTRGGESGGKEEVLGAGRLLSCSHNNCLALSVASGKSLLLVFGVFGADPAQLDSSEKHNEEGAVGEEESSSGTGLKTSTGMALNCSSGILICKQNLKSLVPAFTDTHPRVAFEANRLLAHLTFLAPPEHSKLGIGTYCADLALLDPLFDIFLNREGLNLCPD